MEIASQDDVLGWESESAGVTKDGDALWRILDVVYYVRLVEVALERSFVGDKMGLIVVLQPIDV